MCWAFCGELQCARGPAAQPRELGGDGHCATPPSHGIKQGQSPSPAPATHSQPGLSPVPRWAQGNPGPS